MPGWWTCTSPFLTWASWSAALHSGTLPTGEVLNKVGGHMINLCHVVNDVPTFLQVWQEAQFPPVQHAELDHRPHRRRASKLHLHPGDQELLRLWSQRRLDDIICPA